MLQFMEYSVKFAIVLQLQCDVGSPQCSSIWVSQAIYAKQSKGFKTRQHWVWRLWSAH